MRFRGAKSIILATAREVLSEPLSLLLLLASVALTTLAPAFHYHQFGEATRMARDAGLSALLVVGVVFAVFSVIRPIRREIETGTAEMALSHAVSRGGFFLAKAIGGAVATFLFCLIVAANALTVIRGATIGGEIASRSGDIARLWGPSFALGLATALVPLVVAALLNRFARMRFVPTFFLLATLVSLGGAFYRFDAALTLRLAPVALASVVPSFVFLSSAAAFAIRFRTNVALSATAIVLLFFLPCAGNYCLSDSLSRGGSLSWGYAGLAVLAALPMIAAFLLLGVCFGNRRE